MATELHFLLCSVLESEEIQGVGVLTGNVNVYVRYVRHYISLMVLHDLHFGEPSCETICHYAFPKVILVGDL